MINNLQHNNNYSYSTDELNASKFDNLIAGWYWTGMEYAYDSDLAWACYVNDTYLPFDKEDNPYVFGYGLAVRNGQVLAAASTPEPATMMLCCTGLAGLAAVKRRRRR